MPKNENEEFEFRLRAEKEKSAPLSNPPAPKPEQKTELPRTDGLKEVPDWGVKNPNLYGAYGAGRALLQAGGEAAGAGIGGAIGLASPAPGGTIVGGGMGYAGGKRAGENAVDAMDRMVGQIPEKREHNLGKDIAIGSAMAAVPKGLDAIYKGAVAVPGAIRTLTGSGIPAAKAEAQAATRGALQSGEQGLIQGAAKNTGDAGRWISLQDKASGQLAETRKPGPVTLDSIGSDIHTAFNSAIESAKGSRAQKANEMFTQVKADAATKEATGARVNTQRAEEALKAFSKEAEGIPELRDQATKMLSAIRGKPAVPAPKVTGNQPWPGIGETVAPEPAGKTFEQLELTRRYLNDIAYSGDMEGYSAIVKGKARDTAQAIDSAMQEFLPSFGEYKSTYRTMSEPLDSLNTRPGEALSGTEGGLQGTEYSKIAKADLPNKLFAKKEGIDLLTDAIAGGKNAPAEARAAAKLKVNGMVEDWIAESVRQKTSKAASDFVAAPKMQSALEGRVPPPIEKMIARKGQLEGRVEAFGSKAKGLEAEAETKIKTAQSRFTDKIAKGDYLAQQPSFQADAYAEYRSALTTAGSAKLIPETQFKAALKLLNDAATMEEKTETARRLVKKMGLYSAGGVGAAYEIKRLLQ